MSHIRTIDENIDGTITLSGTGSNSNEGILQ